MKDKNKPILAIIIPCYNEEQIIEQNFNKISSFFNMLIEEEKISENSYISIVDDGSTDNTWNILSDLSDKNSFLKVIKLACNFGHQKALLCGLVSNNADIYVSLDCDLQDDLNTIDEMISVYKNKDVDVVYGVRNSRKTDSFFKRVSAQMYYSFAELMGVCGINNCADFRLVSENVVKLLREIKEQNLYLRGLIPSYNFKYDVVFYERKARTGGYSKYGIGKMLDLALNGIVSSSSVRPIRFILFLALISFVVSLFTKSEVYGSNSLELFALWILGEYIAKTFSESQHRPNFVIANRKNYVE